MSTLAARDLRNHTADALRRVAAGDTVVITSHGRPVARLMPPASGRRSTLSRVDVMQISQADPALRADLADLAGDTTDDLDDLT